MNSDRKCCHRCHTFCASTSPPGCRVIMQERHNDEKLELKSSRQPKIHNWTRRRPATLPKMPADKMSNTGKPRKGLLLSKHHGGSKPMVFQASKWNIKSLLRFVIVLIDTQASKQCHMVHPLAECWW